MGRVRKASLFSVAIVVVCGLWLLQTVFWPRGGTATDLRPLFPILAAAVLLAATWLGTVWLSAVDSYRRLRQSGGEGR